MAEDENKVEGAGKVGMAAFNVVAMSNDGVKLPLRLPDGTVTEEFLVVRGADSKTFRNQQARANREKVKLAKKQNLDPAQVARQNADIDRRLVASLVVDWSFDEECNEVNVAKFLADAPQIQGQIDLFAGDRANFFKKPPQG